MRFAIDIEKVKSRVWMVQVSGYRGVELVLQAATVSHIGFDDAYQWALAQIKTLRVE